ncbi:MAG: hypothetical protein HY908_23425, partial [Myxococcales bacterium]|nr:hypothetical protein [Myxococcales bacterium]
AAAAFGTVVPAPASGRRRPAPPRALEPAELAWVADADHYLCEAVPAPGDRDAAERHARVAFVLAVHHFTAGQRESALELARGLVLDHADLGAAPAALELYLAAVDALGTAPSTPRPACFELLRTDLPALAGAFCAPGRPEAPCATLGRIERDFERLAAEALARQCDAGGPSGLARCREAGDRYLAIWERWRDKTCAGRAPRCREAGAEPRLGEVLYNAARAYQAARAHDRALAVRLEIVDPDNGIAEGELVERTVYELAGQHHATLHFDEAAVWWERYAERYPKSERARQALSDAVLLRLALGEPDRAAADADAFAKLYGAKSAELASRLVLGVASYEADHGEPGRAAARLERAMAALDAGPLDVAWPAHALLGRLLAASGTGARADAEHRRVADAFARVVGKGAAPLRPSGDEEADARAEGRAWNAAAEALFALAEKDRAAAAAVAPPRYRGSGEAADVAAFAAGALGTWLEAREALLRAAMAAYPDRAPFPVPPPVWSARSAAAVAAGWRDLLAALEPTSHPKGWAPAETLRAQVRQAQQRCLEMGAKLLYADDATRACERWLGAHHRRLHPPLDELVPALRAGTGELWLRSPFLEDDGEPVVLEPAR